MNIKIKSHKKLLCFVLLFLFNSQILHAEKVYLNYQDALQLFFAQSEKVEKDKHVLSTQDKAALKKILGYTPVRPAYTFYIGKTQNKIDAYALIDHEIGKVSPITFITLINPQGSIAAIEVMVYREAHGGSVAQKRFLKQFINKSTDSQLRLGGSVRSISGATLSSRAMVKGAKRTLKLWNYFYGKK